MDRNLTWALSVTGIAFASLGLAGYRVHAAEQRDLDEIRGRLEALRAVEPAPMDTEPEQGHIEALEGALRELRARLEQLESAARRTPLVAEASEPRKAPAGEPEPSPTPASDASERHEFLALLDGLVNAGWDFSGSREEYERFLELARESGLLDEVIAELEAEVERFPADAALRMQLADAYVGKLMTAAGPEQGLWGGRAEEQWKEVVALDDDHWRAHSSLGTNYSYYPDVMDRGGDAIRHLQRALEIQRSEAPGHEHVQTYLFLARMYQREGMDDEARAALEEGLNRHPESEELAAALERL